MGGIVAMVTVAMVTVAMVVRCRMERGRKQDKGDWDGVHPVGVRFAYPGCRLSDDGCRLSDHLCRVVPALNTASAA